MVKLVDALDSKSSGPCDHVGSIPTSGTRHEEGFDGHPPARPFFKGYVLMEGIEKGSETLLLVDDEEMVIEVGTLMLEKMGYTVIAAKNGEEALMRYRENKDAIHLVILDMIMPGIGGAETYEKLREVDENVKVLLSSGYCMDDQAMAILDRGCNGLMQKPFNMKTLSKKIREIL